MTGLEIAPSRTRWHVLGYRHNDPTPRPVCGATGVSSLPWDAQVLPPSMCGNCARICRLDELVSGEQSDEIVSGSGPSANGPGPGES